MPTSPIAPLGVILAGGKGERIKGLDAREKPLAIVKDAPIVLHVARALARGGTRRVVVLTGQNHDRILQELSLENSRGMLLDRGEPLVEIEFRFSGEEAGTGGRLLALTPDELAEGSLLSYTDIVSSAPLDALTSLLSKPETVCALLAVNPREPWGRVEITDGQVVNFAEKQTPSDIWINGGVLALSNNIQAFIKDSREMLEVEVMERLLASRLVAAHSHAGWWQAVDTQKDLREVNASPEAAEHLSEHLSLRSL